MTNTTKETSGCPISQELAAIEKMNLAFDKSLAKDTASCAKKFDSAKKKLVRLAAAKAKTIARKKAHTAKVKSKPTAAAKAMLEKSKAAAKVAHDAWTSSKEEMEHIKFFNQKCIKLTKQRRAEASLITKFRKEQDKQAALKAKAKKKPKAKASKAQPAQVVEAA